MLRPRRQRLRLQKFRHLHPQYGAHLPPRGGSAQQQHRNQNPAVKKQLAPARQPQPRLAVYAHRRALRRNQPLPRHLCDEYGRAQPQQPPQIIVAADAKYRFQYPHRHLQTRLGLEARKQPLDRPAGQPVAHQNQYHPPPERRHGFVCRPAPTPITMPGTGVPNADNFRPIMPTTTAAAAACWTITASTV